jgi:hypothetical protein
LVRDRIRGLAEGILNGLYLHGRAGVAKTHMVLSTLEKRGVRYVYLNGHTTPIGLFEALKANPQSVIVIDDDNSLVRNPQGLQMLIAALGAPPDGSNVRPVRHKTAHTDVTVPFEGSIVMISNRSLEEHSSEVIDALKDRVPVMSYEPTDDEIEALIRYLAGQGPRGVTAADAIKVADRLLKLCRELGVRPSLRLFLDKALPDFRLWKQGDSESHWEDLVRSSVQEMVIEPTHELQDMTRKDQVAAEIRLVDAICTSSCDPKVQLSEWRRLTGKSKSAFYRRQKDLDRLARCTVA